jgi:hypothetical protein
MTTKWLLLCSLVSTLLAQQAPEPVKLYIAGGYYAKVVEKQCPNTVTVTTAIQGAQYRLELAQTAKWFKEHGSLYKVIGDDELTKFAASRGSEFAKQICRYFEAAAAIERKEHKHE